MRRERKGGMETKSMERNMRKEKGEKVRRVQKVRKETNCEKKKKVVIVQKGQN